MPRIEYSDNGNAIIPPFQTLAALRNWLTAAGNTLCRTDEIRLMNQWGWVLYPDHFNPPDWYYELSDEQIRRYEARLESMLGPGGLQGLEEELDFLLGNDEETLREQQAEELVLHIGALCAVRFRLPDEGRYLWSRILSSLMLVHPMDGLDMDRLKEYWRKTFYPVALADEFAAKFGFELTEQQLLQLDINGRHDCNESILGDRIIKEYRKPVFPRLWNNSSIRRVPRPSAHDSVYFATGREVHGMPRPLTEENFKKAGIELEPFVLKILELYRDHAGKYHLNTAETEKIFSAKGFPEALREHLENGIKKMYADGKEEIELAPFRFDFTEENHGDLRLLWCMHFVPFLMGKIKESDGILNFNGVVRVTFGGTISQNNIQRMFPFGKKWDKFRATPLFKSLENTRGSLVIEAEKTYEKTYSVNFGGTDKNNIIRNAISKDASAEDNSTIPLVVIKSFTDAIMHYAYGDGEAVQIGENIILQSMSSEKYQTEAVTNIKNYLKNVSKIDASGVVIFEDSFTWKEGYVLGRNTMHYHFILTWTASPWQSNGNKQTREITGRGKLLLNTKDKWDFKPHKNDPIWTTLTAELGPSIVADLITVVLTGKGEPYKMSGAAFVKSITFKVIQDE